MGTEKYSITDPTGITTGVNVLTDLVNTGYGIYDKERSAKLAGDQWSMQKKAMQQDYIANQRKLDWQKRFRDRLLGF